MSWSVASSPNQAADLGYLYDVTCVSASQCWAVGQYNINYGIGSDHYTLIERWDGSSWTVVPSPNLSNYGNALYGIACTSASNCWAVGYGYTPSLIEKWDGSSWSIVESPNQGTRDNYLYSVTCTSASNCWAVGAYIDDNSAFHTLIEKRDGNSWTIVSSPNQGVNDNRLYGVTCTSESQCWAVGFAGTQTLIEKWDGNLWTIVNSPSPGILESVTCTSASQCWAVGLVSSDIVHTLIERWDGNSWTVVSSPSPSITNNYLYDVACTSASDCWAVGYLSGGSGTLIEKWNGSVWVVVSSPNRSSSNILEGVTCVSSSQCWAVGWPSDATLIEEYSLSVPPVTGVASRKMHGVAGNFEIELPLSGPSGIECRNAGGGYNVVFTFVNDVTNCGSAGTSGGSVINGPNPNQCTENLSGVPNAQYTIVTLNNVTDSQNNNGNISVPMGVLIGDGNGSRAVNSGDVGQAKSRIGQPINSTNFRSDINASGTINATDAASIKAKIGTALP